MTEHQVSDPRMTDEVGVRFAIGAAVLLVLTAVEVAGRLHGEYGVASLLVATVLLAVGLDTPHALLLGVAGWAFATGFAVNTLGVLTLSPPDLLRLAVFVPAAWGTARVGGTR
jgi:hypothetical protein